MSLDAMRWARKVKTGKSSAKSVLTWLADMCGADMCAYPSIASLAEVTELDVKTVQSALHHLVGKGLIEDTGERRGRTRQVPVYRLVGVDESVIDAEYTQKRVGSKKKQTQNRMALNTTKNGNITENGCVKDDQTPPIFPGNTPKNGIRNLSKESKDLNPTHNAREQEVEPVDNNPVPEYAGQPGVIFPAAQMIGKFPMRPDWTPTADFPRQAALWGKPLKDGLNLTAELKSFVDYWIAEGKSFAHMQWEQKYASHLQRASATQSRGNTHAGLDKYPATANAAQRRMLDARAAQLRERGQNMEVLGSDAGNLFQSLDGQKRIGSIGPMDCSDWEFDQRPDDERL